MNSSYLSPCVMVRLDDGEVVKFNYNRRKTDVGKPNFKSESVVGLQMCYASIGEQDVPSAYIPTQFKVDADGVATVIPDEFNIISLDDISILHYGYEGDGIDLDIVRQSGLLCAWDFERGFIIWATQDYRFVLEAIRNMMRPGGIKISITKMSRGDFILQKA